MDKEKPGKEPHTINDDFSSRVTGRPLSKRPPRLSPAAIQEFKEIYKAECGEDLSDAQAEEQALRVLRLFQLFLRPLPHHHEHNPHSPE